MKKNLENRKAMSLLLGILAGFTFLLSFLVGIDAPTDAVFIVGVFFILIIIGVIPLLLSDDKTIKRSQ